MTHFHADAVRNRLRVSIHHYSSLFRIPSGTEYESIDDALHTLGLYHLEWNPERDSVRHDYCIEFRSPRFVTDYCYNVDVCFRDYSGLFVNPDVVLRRVDELLAIRRDRFRHVVRGVGYSAENFRKGAVPFTGRGYHARIRRRIRTTAERREAAWIAFDEGAAEGGVRIRPRAKRSFRNLPDYRDDYYRSDRKNNGWKSHRKTQWKES
jgi:hypothetical protein